jgi:hypothetical protein
LLNFRVIFGKDLQCNFLPKFYRAFFAETVKSLILGIWLNIYPDLGNLIFRISAEFYRAFAEIFGGQVVSKLY